MWILYWSTITIFGPLVGCRTLPYPLQSQTPVDYWNRLDILQYLPCTPTTMLSYVIRSSSSDGEMAIAVITAIRQSCLLLAGSQTPFHPARARTAPPNRDFGRHTAAALLESHRIFRPQSSWRTIFSEAEFKRS